MSKNLKSPVKIFKDMDKILLFTTLVLIVFGTLNIVTASSREAVVNMDANIFYYFFRHIIALIISLGSFLIVIHIPTKKYGNWLKYLYVVVLAMNFYLIIKGAATRGAAGWIDLKFMKIQPSELAKPILILSTAFLFEKYNKKLKDPKEKHDIIIWTIIIMAAIFPIIVYFQRDLGTAIILLGIFSVMFVFSPISTSEKIKSALITLVVFIIAALAITSIKGSFLSNEQSSRISDFFNPCSKYEDTGYQVCNAFIAINNGGLTGVGIGKSTQKYSYIPEPHTDMVFAIIAEEHGVIFCAFIFIFYIIILYRILMLSQRTKKLKNKYICLGTATYIFLHILVNLGGLFGIIPLTGVPLPFLSYGGSFTLSLITTLAVIQRIHIETKNEKIRV